MKQLPKLLSGVTIQQMIIFIQVAESNGFAKAAVTLHMTQSAVSKSIAKLESELDIPLFVRTTREIHLTKAGIHLYEEWKKHLTGIFTSYKDALEIFESSGSTLRIGLLNTARPDRYFWEIQKRFMNQYPGVTLDLNSEYMTDLIANLSEDRYDVIMIPDFMHFSLDQLGLSWKWAARRNAILYIPSNHPLATKEKIYLEDLLDLTFVGLGTDLSSNFVADLYERFAKFNRIPSIKSGGDNVYALLYLPPIGDYAMLVDDFFDYPNLMNLVMRPIENEYNGIICAYNPKKLSPHASTFLGVLSEFE